MFVVDKAVKFVEGTGDASNVILLKMDQENSMKYFVTDFIEARGQNYPRRIVGGK